MTITTIQLLPIEHGDIDITITITYPPGIYITETIVLPPGVIIAGR